MTARALCLWRAFIKTRHLILIAKRGSTRQKVHRAHVGTLVQSVWSALEKVESGDWLAERLCENKKKKEKEKKKFL